MLVADVLKLIEEFAPLSYQENYDNAGLLTGYYSQELTGILLTIDITEDVVDEAINNNLNLIISHHPLIFSGLKKITGRNYIERTVIKAIKNDIAVYAAHTNLDNIIGGVNSKIANKLGLINQKILLPNKNQLVKLTIYIPNDYVDKVKDAIFEAGAGTIGNYDQCSFSIEGTGTFRGNLNTNPFIGQPGKPCSTNEVRFETIVPSNLVSKVTKAAIAAHPYEEVAYDLYPLENEYNNTGSGIVGELPEPADEKEFITNTKKIFNCQQIRHTSLINRKITKVAICGGSGSFLLPNAIASGAGIFISSDFKYHQFFDAEGKIIIADIGHFESEQFTKEIFYDLLIKKFSNFVIRFSEVNTNPIKYF